MSSNSQPPERPVRVPEARYDCAGEYCPEPGHRHTADRLYLHTEMNRPGFFCPTCRPVPFPMADKEQIPERITLEQYLRKQQDNGAAFWPANDREAVQRTMF